MAMAGMFPKLRCRNATPQTRCLLIVQTRHRVAVPFEILKVTGIDQLRAMDVSHPKFYHDVWCDVVYRRSKRYVVVTLTC